MSRKNITTEKAMQQINLTTGNEKETTIDKFSEMLKRMRADLFNGNKEQLDYMNAEIFGRTLKSYNTIVAYFDGCNIYELGQYSRTTSKQVTRWAEWHCCNIYRLTDATKYMREMLSDFDNERIQGGYATLYDYYNIYMW